MPNVDLKKELKDLYGASATQAGWVDVPRMNFIMIDGSGNPNKSQEYQDAVEALYSLSYAIKFIVKKEESIDYVVLPLEGLWWTADMARFSIANKDIWQWTSMIMQPEFVKEKLFNAALEQTHKKKKLAALSKTRFEGFAEGRAAQIMHVGPFATEGPTIGKLHQFIEDNGFTFDGLKQKHHEIYLSDFRKSAPEKLRTIIRQAAVKKR